MQYKDLATGKLLGLDIDLQLALEKVAAHIKSYLINERLHTDQRALDAVGRMGGATYAFSTDLFELEAPSLEAWELSRVQPKSTVHE